MTSWIDASFVYSTKEAWVNAMRTFQNGTFKMEGDAIFGMPPKNTQRVPLANHPSPNVLRMLSPERMYCESSLHCLQNLTLVALLRSRCEERAKIQIEQRVVLHHIIKYNAALLRCCQKAENYQIFDLGSGSICHLPSRLHNSLKTSTLASMKRADNAAALPTWIINFYFICKQKFRENDGAKWSLLTSFHLYFTLIGTYIVPTISFMSDC